MAFHVACPITCRRICYCKLGLPKRLQSDNGKDEYLEVVARVEEFLKDPWLIKAREDVTIQVKVPKIVVAPPPIQLPQEAAVAVGGGDGGEEAAAAMASARTKRAALQKKAAAASVVAEDFARRFESGDVENAMKDSVAEQQGLSSTKVMCRLCFCGDNEGSERTRKMLSCKSCGKKYHRSCLQAWGQHRDLFHWSSWTCPTCRLCEGCHRTGDPSKFMFCKRCDASYHCYCMQPPHKNVSNGPYLCPKHTKCHSCGSNVPGNGLSLRWFLGYTCCDACGRLFVKGNYCPVCLKVYRDSESTPMVCCDICQRWVHCQCDAISDERYLQFQVDGNLAYSCPPCRANSYQVSNLEDAVQELWRRRDEADRDLIASLRAAAGLPTQDEIFSISPFSDDEDSGGRVVLKNEYGRSLKFSLKGSVDKSPHKSKECRKNYSHKKYGKRGHRMSLTGPTEAHTDASAGGYHTGDIKNEELQDHGELDNFASPVGGSLTDGVCSINHAGVLKRGVCSINHAGVGQHNFIGESTANSANMTVQMKASKPQHLTAEDNGTQTSMSKTSKGPKLVIHLGSRNKNVTGSPRSDVSSCHKDRDLTASNGHNVDHSDQINCQKLKGKEGHLMKIEKACSGVTDVPHAIVGGKLADLSGPYLSLRKPATVGKRNNGASLIIRPGAEVLATRDDKAEAGPITCAKSNDEKSSTPSTSHLTRRDPKPLLKLKFKNSCNENQNVCALEEEGKSTVKGQRSKRKRLSSCGEKESARGDDDNLSHCYEGDTLDEIMDANWVLQKLGKGAVEKRVEVHNPSDNTWHRGTVTKVFEGTSAVSVSLDDGKKKNLVLGKQAIRFASQKKKR